MIKKCLKIWYKQAYSIKGCLMKKTIVVFLFIMVTVLVSSQNEAANELENAIIEYIPNSKTKSYIPALITYGFKETEIDSWRFTNSFIDQFFSQIYQVFSNNRYEKVIGPDHFIGTIRAVGELKGEELDRVTKFLHDVNAVAQEMNDERLEILGRKIVENKNGIIIYGYNITYDGNGNTGGTAPVDEKLYRSGESAELKSCGDLEKGGHKFMGWSQSVDSSSWLSSSKINVNRDTILYAVWIDFDTLNRLSSIETQQKQEAFERSQTVGYTVYIGQSGAKYHTASCRSLRNYKTAININTAKSRGYTACKICNP